MCGQAWTHKHTHTHGAQPAEQGDRCRGYYQHHLSMPRRGKHTNSCMHMHAHTRARRHTHMHVLLNQRSVDEDGSHCLPGETLFYRCKVTELCHRAENNLHLHTSLMTLCLCFSCVCVRVCTCDIFTFSKQFLWPGMEPLTYSTLYLVLTLHI